MAENQEETKKDQIINTEAAKAKAAEVAGNVKEGANKFVNKFKEDKQFQTTVIAVAGIVVVILLAIILCGGGAKKTAKGYANAYVKCNSKKIVKYMLPGMVEEFEDKLDEDMADYFEENVCEDREDDDIKYTDYEITKIKEMDDDDLEDLAESLEKSDFIEDEEDVKAGYTVKIKYTYKEDGDKETLKEEISVIKVKGHWYVAS